MAEMVKFPSIEQYRNVVKTVRERCSFHGAPLPTLPFIGTVKLHGTNASIGYDYETGELWVQSRNNVITPEADNAGFARWVEENKPFWVELFSQHSPTRSKVVIYGEWCGQGIMKGVAITQLPKMFVVFAAREVDAESETWIPRTRLKSLINGRDLPVRPNNVYVIHDFPVFFTSINFAEPETAQNRLVQLTTEVEHCCPVGRAFGVEGVGEGVVWTVNVEEAIPDLPFQVSDLIFKVKGEKHSDTKVTKLVEVDVEKLANVGEFVSAVLTDHRLEKGLAFLAEQGKDADIKNLGEFLKWVGQDVLKEEADRLEASGLDRKDVMPKVAATAKQWFLQRLT